MKFIKYFIKSVEQIDENPINKNRIKLLSIFIIAHLFFGVVLNFSYAITGQLPQLIRSVIITVSSILVLLSLIYLKNWKTLSHFVAFLLTVLGIWANFFIFAKGINIASIQFIWLASAFGFFMFGRNWGWFYAVINILPVFLDIFHFNPELTRMRIDNSEIAEKPIYVFSLLFEFVLISYIHYFFVKTLNKSIYDLVEQEDELKLKNQQLQKRIIEVDNLSSSRLRFLSTMSHELRTPLNGVIGLTNVLSLQKPRSDQKETLEVLKFSAENLMNLVNNILDYNKLDADMVVLETIPFNFQDLIKGIVSSTKIKSDEKKIDFVTEIDTELNNLTIIGDPTRLTQVLLNLLMNAIKFTNSGTVILYCNEKFRNSEQIGIEFTVEDTGIGIEEHKFQEIFEEFKQADDTINRNFGGSGLGLSIVKKILDLYGTNLEITSARGKGSKFSFQLILKYKIEVSTKNITDLENNYELLKGLKLLVVEDNEINIIVIKKILKTIGIVPDVAMNGAEAINMIKKDKFDIILMDLYMPILDGYETTKQIRELDDSVKANTPIIAITAEVNAKVVEDVKSVGMNCYLPKPFAPKELFEKINKFVLKV